MDIPLIIVHNSLRFLVLFALSLVLFIFARRIVYKRREAYRAVIKRWIEIDVLESMDSARPDEVPFLRGRYVRYPGLLAEVLLEYWGILKGARRGRLKDIFAATLKERFLADLSSRRQLKRLKAARAVVVFADPEDVPRIIRLLEDTPLIRLATLSALTLSPIPEVIDAVFATFEKDSSLNLQAYFDLMSSFGKSIESRVRDFLGRPLPEEKIAFLAEITGNIPLGSLYPDLIRLSGYPGVEVRIKIARALGNLSLPLPEIIQALVRLAGDGAWEVRAQALKSLGGMKSRDTINVLAAGLFSSHWYCRLNAGYALTHLGREGLERLRGVSQQTKDRYAADMALMVLEGIIPAGES